MLKELSPPNIRSVSLANELDIRPLGGLDDRPQSPDGKIRVVGSKVAIRGFDRSPRGLLSSTPVYELALDRVDVLKICGSLEYKFLLEQSVSIHSKIASDEQVRLETSTSERDMWRRKVVTVSPEVGCASIRELSDGRENGT